VRRLFRYEQWLRKKIFIIVSSTKIEEASLLSTPNPSHM